MDALKVDVELLVVLVGVLSPLCLLPTLHDLAPHRDIHPDVELWPRGVSVPPVDGGSLQRGRPITAVETEIDIVVLETLLVEVEVITIGKAATGAHDAII